MALLLEDGNYVTKMPLKATSETIWRFKSNNLWCWSDQEYLWVEPGGSKFLMKGELQKRIFHIKTPDTDPKRGSKGFQVVYNRPNKRLTQNSQLGILFPIGYFLLLVLKYRNVFKNICMFDFSRCSSGRPSSGLVSPWCTWWGTPPCPWTCPTATARAASPGPTTGRPSPPCSR